MTSSGSSETCASIRYDIAIDFQGLLKSGMLIGLARAARKIGFDRTRELSYLFLNERLPAYDIEKHALERYLDVARYLGAKDPSSSCTLPIEREVSAIRRKIDGMNLQGRPLVVVNPVARWKTKLWPERNFAELADRLVKEKNAVVIFTGSPDDRAVNDRIISMMSETAVNWAGETTLKELAALASLCRPLHHHRHRPHAPCGGSGGKGPGAVRPDGAVEDRSLRAVACRRAHGDSMFTVFSRERARSGSAAWRGLRLKK